MSRLFGRLFLIAVRVKRRVMMILLRPLFGGSGKNFWFDPAGQYSFENIFVGDDVFLGLRPVLQATHSRITIGSKVMFGPEVVIMGGNHNSSLLGRFMFDVGEDEKRPEDDVGVVIEDDVWVGTRAIILDGVTIGRGAIVAAGAVVTKSVPPYAVAGGVPARVLSYRWDPETIRQHEEILLGEVRLTEGPGPA